MSPCRRNWCGASFYLSHCGVSNSMYVNRKISIASDCYCCVISVVLRVFGASSNVIGGVVVVLLVLCRSNEGNRCLQILQNLSVLFYRENNLILPRTGIGTSLSKFINNKKMIRLEMQTIYQPALYRYFLQFLSSVGPTTSVHENT